MRQTHWFPAGVLLVISLALLGLPSRAQRGRPLGTIPPPISAEPEPTIPPLEQTLRRKMVKASYARLQKDTEQLVKLTSELKAEVDKANEDTLSLGVIKKAEEIEKLAEKIRNRMKNL